MTATLIAMRDGRTRHPAARRHGDHVAGITGLTHSQAWFDLAMTAMVVPFVSLIVLITLGSLFGSF